MNMCNSSVEVYGTLEYLRQINDIITTKAVLWLPVGYDLPNF